MSQLLNIADAARVFGLSRSSLKAALQEGRLSDAKDRDGHWLIRREDVAAFATSFARRRTDLPLSLGEPTKTFASAIDQIVADFYRGELTQENALSLIYAPDPVTALVDHRRAA